nr:reverse transcriptase domain-containing protein [Tanacetum cinerariifolium]
MNTNKQTPLSQPTFVVKNTLGREQAPQNLVRPFPDEDEGVPGKLPPTEKCIKDPVEIHNIKQRNEESTEELVRRYKLECMDVKGAPECIKISRFMHRITNPELIKRLHDKIPKSIDEIMGVTVTFLREEMAASNRERKKSKQDRFTLLTKTPREIIALDKGKFKPPPPMTTLVEKRNASKFYEFHREVDHTTDECMHLKRKIEEMLKAGKLSHLIKELKQNNRKDQEKTAKKGETSGKDKHMAILMVQPWKRIMKQRITQTFSPESVISFPTLREEDEMEGPMIIEAEMGGNCVHRIYVDGGSSLEILKGTFLGYKVDADGLRVSLDKVKAVIDLPSPKCLKDVQKLNGKLASLNRFLSKSAEKSLPFFKTLKKCTKKNDFQWTPEAEEEFKEVKQSIAKLTMLMAPKEK